jgi:hypothetical protein
MEDILALIAMVMVMDIAIAIAMEKEKEDVADIITDMSMATKTSLIMTTMTLPKRSMIITMTTIARAIKYLIMNQPHSTTLAFLS